MFKFIQELDFDIKMGITVGILAICGMLGLCHYLDRPATDEQFNTFSWKAHG